MLEQRHVGGVVTWTFGTAPAEVVAAVTTRAGGTSKGVYASANLGAHVGDDPVLVAANRDAVAAALGLGPLTIADQQHGRRVAVVDARLSGAGHDPTAPLDERLVGTDALVTVVPGVALAVLVADCAPVVIVDPQRGALGVAHAGRRGAVLDVLAATVEAMGELAGSRPADLWAGVGPCIGARSYEIAGDALDEVRAELGEHFLEPTTAGRATFDLEAAVVHRLRCAGVPRDRIEIAGTSTDARPDVLFSDRSARPCGRFGLVAALRGAPDSGR